MSTREEDHDFRAMQALDAARAAPPTGAISSVDVAQVQATIAAAEATLAVHDVLAAINRGMQE